MKDTDIIEDEIETALERTASAAGKDWMREMLVCCYVAAVENEYVIVDKVWDIFERRKSGIETKCKLAMGGVLRLAARMKWISYEATALSKGMETMRNHNRRGIACWKSEIYLPGIRIGNSFMNRRQEKETEQLVLF